MIEDKTQRVGEAGVKVVEMAEDLEDTKEDLAADQKFLVELEKGCSTKDAEWAARCKTRSEELVALAETIKILNDDDALELFKKTLHGSDSFIQLVVTHKDVVAHAATVISKSQRQQKDYRMDAILLALSGKSVDFSKVIEMIDNMVSLLGKEQVDDTAKLEQCKTDLDLAEDKKKELDRSISLLEKRIEDDKSAIATLSEEIDALVSAIKALDKELTEEQRLTQNFGGSLAPTSAPGGIAGTGIGFV